MKSGGRPYEQSEEVIVLLRTKTTQLGRREGPLLQPCPARRYVMVHAREGQPHPKESSRQLQRRLYLAAKRHDQRRFHALYDRLFRPDILWRAWQEVRANGGAAGVDGVSIEAIESQGVESFLQTLAADLKAKRYRPQPVLRVYTPKPDGRQRPLGIPTIRDRVVQQACRIVVKPDPVCR